MKIAAYLLPLLALASPAAFAMKVECSTLNDTPSAAGYYVEVKGESATLSHQDSNGKDTFDPETYKVSLAFEGGRLTSVSGEGFDMNFESPFDNDSSDLSRGNYTLKAELSSGRKISLVKNTLFCHVTN
jgi:hypothetical protein